MTRSHAHNRTPLRPPNALVGAPNSTAEERCAAATHHAKVAWFRPASSSDGEASPGTIVQGAEEDAKSDKERCKQCR
jgi:hypothetical protein